MTHSIHIRPAEAGDEDRILALIQALADYEKEPDAVQATRADLARHLFDATPSAFCLLAFREGATVPAGFALYFFTFSTWAGRQTLYLEDLFVRPADRKHGIGTALLRELARIAVARDCGRMEWAALDWNTLATDFYRKLGAIPMDDWTTFRLEGEGIRKLTGS
ncbi:MAG: N-acetyltransferase family protein [Opitutales bacterium]